jgi:hypothetical protein
MPPPDELDFFRPPPPPARRGKDILVAVVLLGLALLTAILWFADPAHQATGGSRVGWPPAASAKP